MSKNLMTFERKVPLYYRVKCLCGLDAEYVDDYKSYPNAALAHLNDYPSHEISVTRHDDTSGEYVVVYDTGQIEAGDSC